MQTKALLFILVISLVMLPACGDRESGPSGSDQAKIKVETVPAQYLPVAAVVETPGTVQARHRIALSAQINGFVHEINVRVGDRVKTGQLLAALDARDAANQQAAALAGINEAKAALAEARSAYQSAQDMRTASKASLDLAEQTFTRYQKLFETRSVSPQEMDEIRARRDAAGAELAARESMVTAAEDRIRQVEARISQAEAQAGRSDVLMSYTRITAPESGLVVERSVDPGTAIFPGTPLLVLESTGRSQVLSSLPAENAGHLRTGLETRVLLSDTASPINGRISEIVPQSNSSTHSVQFKIDLPPDAQVIHGQFVRVEVPAGTRDALLVSRAAVRASGQLEGVFIVEDGSKARFRLVKTNAYDADQAEILSGIEKGEQIIVRTNGRIADGMPVEIQR